MIRTSRLTIRRYAPDDLPAYRIYRADPEVRRFQSYGKDEGDLDAWALAYFREMAEREPDDGDWFNFCVVRTSDGMPVGDVGICGGPAGVQVGYGLIGAHRGNGYCRESVAGVLDWIARRGATRAIAEIEADNLASRAVVAALGFIEARRFDDAGVEVTVFERDLPIQSGAPA